MIATAHRTHGRARSYDAGKRLGGLTSLSRLLPICNLCLDRLRHIIHKSFKTLEYLSRLLTGLLPLRERATPQAQQKRRGEGADTPHPFELAVIWTLPSPARGEGPITGIGVPCAVCEAV
jgi:hypothetical protein